MLRPQTGKVAGDLPSCQEFRAVKQPLYLPLVPIPLKVKANLLLLDFQCSDVVDVEHFQTAPPV